MDRQHAPAAGEEQAASQGAGRRATCPCDLGRSSSGENGVVTETLMMSNGAAEEQMTLSEIGAR